MTRAAEAATAAGVTHTISRIGSVGSAAEAAAARGIALGDLVKTIVVRRASDDYVLVLVPADRTIDWGPLRKALGVNRATLPDAEEAFAATGYRRGTITPFGTTGTWPVIADADLLREREVSIGGGEPGVALHLSAAELIRGTGATVAAVTKPVAAEGPGPGGA